MKTPFRATAIASGSDHLKRRITAGLIIAIPALVTFWVIELTLEFVVASGEPLARILASFVRPFSSDLSALIVSDGLRWAVAITLMLSTLYLLGAVTQRMTGRMLWEKVERHVLEIPVIDMVYGGVRDLVASLNNSNGALNNGRAVLIEFPGPHMRTLGFLTRTMRDTTTGDELGVVYVPTTPNPTSGYVEIVPMSRLTHLDWTPQEAMRFVVSGGTAGPEEVNFHKPDRSGTVVTLPENDPQDQSPNRRNAL